MAKDTWAWVRGEDLKERRKAKHDIEVAIPAMANGASEAGVEVS